MTDNLEIFSQPKSIFPSSSRSLSNLKTIEPRDGNKAQTKLGGINLNTKERTKIMISKETNSREKDVLALRQKLLEELQQNIIKSLQTSDFKKILRKYGEESIAFSSNIIIKHDGHLQLNILLCTGNYDIPSPCRCTTQYIVCINGVKSMKNCPCP